MIIYSQGTTEKLDLVDFPVMIEIYSDDLIHVPGSCGNKIQNIEGKDITFTLTSSNTPLNFQLDYYNAVTGKLICWVKVPVLSAEGSPTSETSLYFYYGSTKLHNPYNAENLSTWSSDYTRIWHMNLDAFPATTKNVKVAASAHNLEGGTTVDSTNYVDGKVGKAVVLNGSTASFRSDTENSTAITISAWVKLNSIGNEQVILTNDSIKTSNNIALTDGYKLKINASGQPVLELYKSGSLYNLQAASPLLINKWYYINGLSSGTDISLFIDGAKVGGRTGGTQRLGTGGSILVGASKQNASFLNGTLDELRIQNAVRSPEWLKTEYTNQINPSEFYTVYDEEHNPSVFSVFTGNINNSWSLPSNWSNGIVPAQNASIVISAGKTLDFTNAPDYILNTVIVEHGAKWTVKSTVSINCTALIGENAVVTIEDHAKLTLRNGVINNGLVRSGQTGTLAFSVEATTLKYSGSGLTEVYCLEVDASDEAYAVELLAAIEVYDKVLLKKGKLITNANLTLLASKDGSAAIFPIPEQAEIIGDVHVQKYISGEYPQPASARGWRLLSSPVYNSISNGSKYYKLNAFQKSMFVTGQGGSVNGFDQSPLNGNTIFTHDQSIVGSLSQKFVPIPNMSSNIEFGRALYIFSRGNRNLPNAYSNQIANMPFSNPAGYLIQYSGQVHSGDLTMEVSNKNNNEAGDGFNLIGNPYASPLLWGSINKVNIGPYVWLFDPLNNAYFVSDDPSTIIPSGEGFFVKVNNESTKGTIKFTEYSKHTGTSSYARTAGISPVSNTHSGTNTPNLLVCLARDEFKQEYKVIFDKNGEDEVTDQDALKIGEGYVSIAALVNNNKLAIDHRANLDTKKEIKLYVKGWATGDYKLDIKGRDSFDDRIEIRLVDKFINKSEPIKLENFRYNFHIDLNNPTSQGAERFSLLFEEKETAPILTTLNNTIYPNPFSDKFHLKTVNSNLSAAEVIIRNTHGQTVFKQTINLKGNDPEIAVGSLQTGLYFVQIVDILTNQTVTTVKAVKQ